MKFVNAALRLLANRGHGLNPSVKKEIKVKLNDFIRINNLSNDFNYREIRERMFYQNCGALVKFGWKPRMKTV